MKQPIDLPADVLQDWQDRTFPTQFVSTVGSLIALAVLVGVMAVYFIVWWDNPFSMLDDISIVGIAFASVAVLLGIVVHEGLHALGFMLSGGERKHIRFGIFWDQMMPYAHCEVPLSARGYRFSLLLPAIVLGLAPTLAGMALHAPWLTAYGAMMLATAAGDFMIVWCLRGVDARSQVRDHPNKPGCQVLE